MDEMRTGPIRILMIGPLPPPIGGTTVLFQALVTALSDRPDVDVRVIDLRPVRGNPAQALMQIYDLVRGLLRFTSKSDVVALHCNSNAVYLRVTLVNAIVRLFGKPLVVRTFGGNRLQADSTSGQSDKALQALRKADLYLGETLLQVTEAREGGVARAEWFPNHRPMPSLDDGRFGDGDECRRFVFMSHVKPSKGIQELIEAGERFGSEVSVDVYGPFEDGMTEAVFDGCRRVRYRGVVEPDQVLHVLSLYDAVLLPTYYSGEGYPGIIIEAYAVGIPVICTRWLRLPELVDESVGVLVEPRSAEALHQAMKSLLDEPDRYRRLRRGVLEKRSAFDVNVWSERFVQYCRETVAGRR